MATKTFGAEPAKERDYVAELQKEVGVKFPIQVTTQNGELINLSYETEWQEGGTRPIETSEIDEAGNPVIEYEENYTKHKLTAAQIKKIDAWAKENIAL